MAIAYVDESMHKNIVSIGIVVMDTASLDSVHRYLISSYRSILRNFGARYEISEAKFSYVLNVVAKKHNLGNEEVENLIVKPILRVLLDRCLLLSIIAERGETDLTIPHAEIFREKWFLKAYRSLMKKPAAYPKQKTVFYARLIYFLLSSMLDNVSRIVIDKNLGGMGKHQEQLVAVLSILTNRDIRSADSQKEKGIQIADFIAGASRYIRKS